MQPVLDGGHGAGTTTGEEEAETGLWADDRGQAGNGSRPTVDPPWGVGAPPGRWQPPPSAKPLPPVAVRRQRLGCGSEAGLLLLERKWQQWGVAA